MNWLGRIFKKPKARYEGVVGMRGVVSGEVSDKNGEVTGIGAVYDVSLYNDPMKEMVLISAQKPGPFRDSLRKMNSSKKWILVIYEQKR